MSKSISFNWDEIRNLSKRTLENFEVLENSNQKIQEITKSLSSCWKGVDANTFENTMNNYIAELTADAKYFRYLGEYFDTAAKTINGTVDTYDDVMGRMENEIGDKKDQISRQVRI